MTTASPSVVPVSSGRTSCPPMNPDLTGRGGRAIRSSAGGSVSKTSDTMGWSRSCSRMRCTGRSMSGRSRIGTTSAAMSSGGWKANRYRKARRMLSKMRRPSRTACTIVVKLSSSSTIAAASRATAVPRDPMATPMSASRSAGASLTPSPVIATTSPRRRSVFGRAAASARGGCARRCSRPRPWRRARPRRARRSARRSR